MANMFVPKPVSAATIAELNARKNTKTNMQWAAVRFPWIHIQSMCGGCVGRYVTIESAQIPASYYEDPSYKLLPIVTEVSVKKQGELGTTKKATIKITAFTDAQLLELQKCYFIPGMSVRVQWGWSISCKDWSSGVKRTPKPIIDRNLSDQAANQKMRTQALSDAAYDGLQGPVANFSFNLVGGSTWECSIDIISASEAITEATVEGNEEDSCAKNVKKKGDDGSEKTVLINKPALWNTFYNIYDTYSGDSAIADMTAGIIRMGKTTYPILPLIYQHQYEGPSRKVDGTAGWGSFFTETMGTGTTEDYISFGAFIALVNYKCIPSDPTAFVVGSINTDEVLLPYHPDMLSTDPRVCLIPGAKDQNRVLDTWDDTISDGSEGDFRSAIVGGKILLNNIRVNVLFLMLELDAVMESGDKKITTYVRNVLKKISIVTGGLWELDIMSKDEEDDPKIKYPQITIVESKSMMPTMKTAKSYEIPSDAVGQNASILREWKLDLKMTDAMKTQAVYSPNTKHKSTADKCTPTLFRAFGLSAADYFKNLANPKPAKIPSSTCSGEEDKPADLSDLLDEIEDGVTDEACESAATRLHEIYEESAKKEAESGKPVQCQGILLPFDFGFTLDGIGGFRWGTGISSTRIPQALKDALIWQITAAEHTVTANDWVTTITTVATNRPN